MTNSLKPNELPELFEPPTSFGAKLSRKIVPMRAQRNLRIKLQQPIVSFTFDDFPRSARYAGADILALQGWRGTFYVSGGKKGVENHHGENYQQADLTHIHECGHEIGGHTFSHVDCSELSDEQLGAEIDRNEAALSAMGVTTPLEQFAWPYGTTTAAHKTALETRFKSMRGVTPGVNIRTADLNCLKSAPLYSGEEYAKTTDLISGLRHKPGWLILFTHDIRDNPSKWGITPSDFRRAIDAVKQSGAQVLSVGAALTQLQK